jgi:hypothetical protein
MDHLSKEVIGRAYKALMCFYAVLSFFSITNYASLKNPNFLIAAYYYPVILVALSIFSGNFFADKQYSKSKSLINNTFVIFFFILMFTGISTFAPYPVIWGTVLFLCSIPILIYISWKWFKFTNNKTDLFSKSKSQQAIYASSVGYGILASALIPVLYGQDTSLVCYTLALYVLLGYLFASAGLIFLRYLSESQKNKHGFSKLAGESLEGRAITPFSNSANGIEDEALQSCSGSEISHTGYGNTESSKEEVEPEIEKNILNHYNQFSWRLWSTVMIISLLLLIISLVLNSVGI